MKMPTSFENTEFRNENVKPYENTKIQKEKTICS
jgi:hypothetical protein